MGKLNLALRNAPRERQAQIMANATVAAKKKENPDMDKSEIKKASQQALSAARISVGAKRTTIDITDKEWEAIQAGATQTLIKYVSEQHREQPQHLVLQNRI